MKLYFKRINIIAIFLSFLVLGYSCVAYRSHGVSLDEAVASGDRSKVVNTVGESQNFKSIEKIDGHYYGVKLKGGENVRTPLDETKVRTVRLHNKTLSTILNISATSVILGTILLFALADSLVDASPSFSGID